MSSTAEKAAPTKTYRFISKGLHFQLQRRPPLQHTKDSGDRVLTDPGLFLDFGTPFRVVGEHLPRGVFETTDEELAQWMREQVSFGTEFWEHGNEPDAVHPTIAELAPLIAKATSEIDAGALNELLEQERATHNRHDVVTILEASLVALDAAEGEK